MRIRLAKAEDIEPHTVDYSLCSFLMPVHPNHCVPGEDYCRGGVILRLMDESGAFVATQHNYRYSFTANFDAVHFHRQVKIGRSVISR